MMTKKIFTLIIFVLISFTVIAEELIADWPLNESAGAKVLVDSAGKYHLTKHVSKVKGVWSGYSNIYFNSLDMRNTPWTLEGSFQTTGKHSGISVIAGTRGALSNYTGWDFMMINGKLRIMAVKNRKESVTLFCPRRLDDGNIHHFALSWNPANGNRGRINLIIDKKYRYTSSGVGDLGENSGRFFGIGCQPTKTKKALVWKSGSLKNFKLMKGALAELKFKLVNQSESVFTDRFPEKALLLRPVVTPRNAKFGIIATVLSDKAERVSLKIGKIKSESNRPFTGTVSMRNLIPVHVEGNTQGPVKNYPGGKVHDYWIPYFSRLAPFDVLEAVDNAPHDGIMLSPGKVAGVLLGFSIPANTVPGLYNGELILKSANSKSSLPFSFRVYPTVMPDKYAVDSMHWLWPEPENLKPGKAVKWWSEAHWTLLKNSGKVMLESGDNTLFTPLIFSEEPLIRTVLRRDGTYHFDMTGFERWIKTFSKLGFKSFVGHHLHSWMLPLYVFDKKNGKKRKIGLESEERRKIYIAFLPRLYASLKKLNKIDAYMQHIIDEPRLSQLKTYRDYLGLCHKYMPGVRNLDALCRATKTIYPLVDVPVILYLLPVNIKNRPNESGKRNVWLYSATSPWPPLPNRHLDRALIENRLWPLLCVKLGRNGYLNWAANIYRGADEYATSIGPLPNGSQNPGHPPGDAWFFYRGPDGLRTGLRMLNFRDGMIDATLMEILRKKKPGRVQPLLDSIIFSNMRDAYKVNIGSQKLAKLIGRGYSVEPEQYNALRERVLKELK